MGYNEDRILSAMVRMQAAEPACDDHMFVFPTDANLIKAVLKSGYPCRILEDDGMILMCRDSETDGSPWTPSVRTIPAIDRRSLEDTLRQACEAVQRAQRSVLNARANRLRSLEMLELARQSRVRRTKLAFSA